MTTASATAGTGPELDQRDDTRETPVRDPHGPRVEASGPDWTADHNGPSIPVADPGADQSPGLSTPRRPTRSWPVLVLAAPAAVAVWSGWVGIGQMTGFGEIRPLPGLWGSLHLNTAVTLPIGVEAYAAFALHVWLTSNTVVSHRTRRFARWSAIAALVLGMAGQVAYHLLTQASVTRAPWEVTTLVSCLPVVVLGMGSSLAHLLRSDAANKRLAEIKSDQSCAQELSTHNWPGKSTADLESQDQWRTGSPAGATSSGHSGRLAAPSLGGVTRKIAGERPPLDYAHDGRARPPARVRLNDAHAVAIELIASGQRISRRSLRSAGLHGSNADLGMLARTLRASPPC